jgi:riboflavin kinase/FMN adenylyltransferase
MQSPATIPDLQSLNGPVFLAIGVFDGVHLGHRAVLERTRTDAAAAGGIAAAVTFDPHPARVLRPEKAPRLLTSTGHKLRIIRSLGIEHVVVISFSSEFAALEPEAFIRQLAASCQLREICVGHEWCFGRNRTGNLALLDRLGRTLGFDEVGVPAVTVDGENVSSTTIRCAIETGDLARAARLLGRPYAVLGTVRKGDQIGRQLGFPTANLAAHHEQFPPNGVYAVEILRGSARHPGVANIGVRPTIAAASGERILEVHLFDFDAHLYGEDLEVIFRHHLRPEQKFSSLDTLRTQIAADAAAAKTWLAAHP